MGLAGGRNTWSASGTLYLFLVMGSLMNNQNQKYISTIELQVRALDVLSLVPKILDLDISVDVQGFHSRRSLAPMTGGFARYRTQFASVMGRASYSLHRCVPAMKLVFRSSIEPMMLQEQSATPRYILPQLLPVRVA